MFVVAYTQWTLEPASDWCKDHKNKAKDMTPIDLTALLRHRQICRLGTRVDTGEDDIMLQAPYEVAVEIADRGKDASDPGAQYAVTGLEIKNLDSECDVLIDDNKLAAGQRTKLHPGAKITLGDEYCFVLERNEHARA
jgi:hypothetical protein